MKEPLFWLAIALHYFSITVAAVFNIPVFTTISLFTFFLIPSLTETEIIPGMKQSLYAQIQVLKTLKNTEPEKL